MNGSQQDSTKRRQKKPPDTKIKQTEK